jgi:type 1 glutamine amidotransferase
MADSRYLNSQRRQRCLLALVVAGLVFASGTRLQSAETTQFTILVFSKTTGFRHDSIPDGIAAIRTLGAEHGFAVDATEDATTFADGALARYQAVVFLCTTGDVLDPEQRAAFERYIRSGGGFVGIHSASDTEYHWPWYGQLVGAYFTSHPQIQRATVHITDPSHPSTKGLPAIWERIDEWYDFRTSPRGTVHVLATVDEATYSGGKMGSDHPIAWCHVLEGGRSWYTAMGHTKGSYAEPLFRLHLLGGIESAAGVAGGCPQPKPPE